MEDRRIILNQIKTPDGTILKSMHRHDYVTYTDKNGLEYMVDGGSDYLRRTLQKDLDQAYEELTIYSDDSFETIRENFHRGGRGKDGTEPLTWVPMSKMSDVWLLASITYNEDRGMGESFANEMYKKELMYRQAQGISIED
jgi:hypothetical protein